MSGMDKRAAAERRAAAVAREERRRAAHFAAATATLVEALPERLSRAQERRQVALELQTETQAITVRRADPVQARLVLSRPDREGTAVAVQLLYGEEPPVLDVQARTADLLAGDLDLLLDWLVRCTDRDHPAAPEIVGLFEQQREEEREREREEALGRKRTWLLIAGHTGLLLLFLSVVFYFPFWILAPIGLSIGLWSRNRLEEMNSTAGVWSSGCIVLIAGTLTAALCLFGLWTILFFVRG